MINDILEELLKNQEILGYVFVKQDKGEVYSKSSIDLEGEIVGGLGSSLVGLLSQVSNSLMMGDFEHIIVEMKRGRMIINKVNNDVLIVLTTKGGNLGTVTYCISKTIKKLIEYI
jgi:predicted regulator of Ras-like GTPase activity (Roadblock/LC7/MglB family)